MWWGICSVATIRIGFWIESKLQDHKLRQELACSFSLLNYFCLTGLKHTGAIDVKRYRSVLGENHLLKCWRWLSLLNLTGTLALSILPKLPPRKLDPWFFLQNLFLLSLLFISINLPCSHVLNTVVMPRLVLLVATCNCWISYKSSYAGLLVLHCCLS